MPGDFGFDPLGLASDNNLIGWYVLDCGAIDLALVQLGTLLLWGKFLNEDWLTRQRPKRKLLNRIHMEMWTFYSRVSRETRRLLGSIWCALSENVRIS